MLRWMLVVTACATIACSSSAPAAPVAAAALPDTFAGAWRSVTSSLEFMRLTVASTSSERGALAARLTFSGVAWEGGGRIVGDSLVIDMAMPGSITPTGVMVAHSTDAQTLRVRLSPQGGVPLNLTFVRDTP
jgi:hypothetical protein